MIRVIFFSFCILSLFSCTLQEESNLSSLIRVIPAPSGAGDTVRPISPIIFLGENRNAICRPQSVSAEDIRRTLKDEAGNEEVFEEVFGFSGDTSEPTNQATNTENDNDDGSTQVTRNTQDTESTEAQTASGVGSNWLKLGLFIENASTFFLVIDNLVFTGTGREKKQTFNFNATISSGYCGDSDFLYIVTPGKSVRYRPKTNNPFHNLTLFVGGFDIIENYDSEGNTNTQEGANSLQNTGSSQRGASLIDQVSSQVENSKPLGVGRDSRPIVIPKYNIRLTLIGYFLTHRGERAATFAKTVTFTTQSSLDY